MCSSRCAIYYSNASQGRSNLVIAQLGGIALGLAIGGAVFVNGAMNHLIPVLPTLNHSQILQVVSGTSNDFFNSLSSDVRDQALFGIVDSLRKMSVPKHHDHMTFSIADPRVSFILVYVGAAVGLVCSVFLEARKRTNIRETYLWANVA